jgi:hypothetical protein
MVAQAQPLILSAAAVVALVELVALILELPEALVVLAFHPQ